VRSFCVLLAKLLKDVPDNPAVRVLRAFADRAESVFYLDEMPHARAAWTILREMLIEAKLPVPVDCTSLGVTRWVNRPAVEQEWRSLIEPRDGAASVLLVHGPAGVGKRTFLEYVAAELAAEGAHVVNLLGADRPDLKWLDLNAAAEKRRFVLLEAACPMIVELRRSLLAANWQVVVAEDSEREPGADAWRATGAAVRAWRIPPFGARDWYRWIATSV
jgi:hypothetical protein